jgi:hypothetical protein
VPRAEEWFAKRVACVGCVSRFSHPMSDACKDKGHVAGLDVSHVTGSKRRRIGTPNSRG